MVAADFIDACKTADYNLCRQCWARVAAGLSPFAANLMGRIALFASITDAKDVGCYPSYNQWARGGEPV